MSSVLAVAIGYAAIGAVAAAIGWRRRRSLVDAGLHHGLWPMVAPVLMLGGGGDRERELLAALRRAAVTPLGSILPDEATGRALARRLREASARLRAIDAVLARPGTAALRADAMDRVRQLRQRLAGQLAEVDQLIAQLVALADVVGVTGGDAAVTDLACDLVARVGMLDQRMTDDGAFDPVDSTGSAASPGGR
jgi:hypothetical protein